MRIIPAIDIIDGKCVRLSKGDYDTKIIYNENPLEVAKSFEAHGIEYLHLVDLDGAKSSKIVNYKILEQIATQTKLKIDFGGGLKSDTDLKIAFESGANQITGGSIAVKNAELFSSWITKFGTEKLILGAQRALQFGGEQLFKHEARMYNCTVSHVDRPRFFQEAMYMLLCGCGVGFSVQTQHINKLPDLKKRSLKKSKVFTIPDTIEGWADSFGVLLASYFDHDGEFKEYRGVQVHFDYSKSRPKGAMISGGFKAPGPDGLRQSLQKCEALIEGLFTGDTNFVRMPSIVAYDFVMHMSDAVLSGGAVARIAASELDELVVTDTIPLTPEAMKVAKIRQLSVAPILAETLSRISKGDSVMSMFAE